MKCSFQRTRTYGGCCRPATVTRDGKPFCWQHDPERRAETAAKDKAVRAAEVAKLEAAHDFRVRMFRAGLVNVTPEQLEAVEQLGGLAAMISALKRSNDPGFAGLISGCGIISRVGQPHTGD